MAEAVEQYREITSLNQEISYFLLKLDKFSNTYNIIDKHLSKSLSEVVQKIDEFLKQEPKVVKVGNTSFDDIDIESQSLQLHRSYFCEACNGNVSAKKDKLLQHFDSDKHLKNLCLYNLSKQKKETVLKNGKEQEPIIVPAVSKNLEFNEKLNSLTESLLTEDLLAVINEQIKAGEKIMHSPSHDIIINDLTNILKPHFGYVKVYAFGSRVNGIGTKDSDLDLYIDLEHTYNKFGFSEIDRIEKDVMKTYKILESNKNQWTDLHKIIRTRVPIIRVLHKETNIDLDLSFNCGLACCNTNLINYFLELQPVFKKMVVFMKLWMKETRLKCSTYSIVMLIVFYLQGQGILPTIQTLQQNIKPFLIGPWQGNFVKKSLNELNIKVCDDIYTHLKGFFNTYSTMEIFSDKVISPYLGCTIPKKSFVTLQNIPGLDVYNEYVKLYRKQKKFLFLHSTPLCVQDPFELSHNIGKYVELNMLMKFVGLCKASRDCLGNLEQSKNRKKSKS